MSSGLPPKDDRPPAGDAPVMAGYPARVLEHYEDPYHHERLERPSHAAERELPICEAAREASTDPPATDGPGAVIAAGPNALRLGTDRLGIELRLTPEGEIAEAAFTGQGCVLSQAAASMLVERVEGMTLSAAKQFSSADMLACYGEPIAAGRKRCVLLAWRTFQAALDCPLTYDELGVPHPFGGPSLNEET